VAARNKIVDLRNLLAERFPPSPLARASRLQTGVAVFDAATDGGPLKGAITEIVSPVLSAGSASLIHALLHSAWQNRYFIALIDGRDSLDLEPLGNSCLQHLLWLRCQNAVETVKAADVLLRDANFPLVIVDLVLNSDARKIPQTTWYRLQRLAEPTSTALLVLDRYSTVASAQLKLVLENRWTLSSLENEDVLLDLRLKIQRPATGGRGLVGAVA
jgi:RecA/RadA recombinase